MKASLRKLDLTYEASFSAPSFDLPARSTALLKALYENLGSDIHIGPDDMHVVNGTKLSEVHVGVTLLGGLARIDIAADKLSLEFKGLWNDADLDICKFCLRRSEQAVKSELPDVVVNTVFFNSLLFLELDGGAGNSREHMAQAAGYPTRFNLSEFCGATLQSKIAINVENTEENWLAMMSAWPVAGQPDTLNVSCIVRYGAGGAIHGLDSQADHIRSLVKMFLSGIDLAISDSTWSNR